ncbi:MAG: nucleoside 2-deoxyribosyltransferase [Promethearchaeota archaeon]
MKKLYLAGPYGFSEIGSHGIQKLKEFLTQFYIIIDPFKDSSNAILSDQITAIHHKLFDPEENHNFPTSQKQLDKLNMEIATQNEELLHQSDFILAILDGADIDSGTAAEIGMGYSHGKKIYGYRGDFRWSGDNLGTKINLQVEYCIRKSGGCIFYSFEELERFFRKNP